MADIAQVLATGGMTIVAVGVGAGLTYWFGALNRRHQQSREDTTRWYEARREAYGALLIAAHRVSIATMDTLGAGRSVDELMDEMIAAIGAVRLVGSPETIKAADDLFVAIAMDRGNFEQKLMEINPQLVEAIRENPDLLEEELENAQSAVHLAAARKAFEEAARADLGHPTASAEKASA